MSIKATIIGAAPPETGGKLTPTRLGSPGAGGVAPIQRQTAIRPTAFQPTTMQCTARQPPPPAPAPASVPAKPTAMPFQPTVPSPLPVAVVAEPVKASALPGTQRKPLDVSFDALAVRFPGTDPRVLERVQAVLTGVSPQSMSTTAWLSFAVPTQESIGALIKERLALMDASVARSVAQHLARLQSLLQDVLDAMDGGFLKKPAAKVWESVVGEVRQLEGLLSAAGPALVLMLGTMGELMGKNRDAGEVLQANALAAEYLIDILQADAGQLLLSRLTSLTTSQALVLEQLQTLTLETTNVQELLTLVQDGVLLQLPSVYSQLAGLSTKPSDTQRFLATEKLAELAQSIQRKL